MRTKLTIDKAGRVVLPKNIRNEFQLDPGTELEVDLTSDHIELRPVRHRSPMVKEGGIWVYRSGSDKALSREEVRELMHRLRNERS